MKIINFGSCNIDYVYSLDHIVNVGETETAYKLETFAGISENENYCDILKKASAASAIAVSRMGAAPSIPKMDEVKKFIAK